MPTVMVGTPSLPSGVGAYSEQTEDADPRTAYFEDLVKVFSSACRCIGGRIRGFI